MVHHYKESVAGRLAISADPIIRCKMSFGFILTGQQAATLPFSRDDYLEFLKHEARTNNTLESREALQQFKLKMYEITSVF